MSVVDPVSVTDIEAALGAIPPDRVLDVPGKDLRKRWVELPSIDPLGDGLNDVRAAAGPVAGRAIRVVRVEPGEYAPSVQKIVNQGVDRDHAAADLVGPAPGWPFSPGEIFAPVYL